MAAAHYIALVVGVLFILAGLVKLIPLDPKQEGHGLPDMSRDFERFFTVLPLKDLFGIKTAAMYISLVGIDELMFGALLAFGRPSYRVFSAVWLLGIMVGAFYTLFTLEDPVPTMIPSVVFAAALSFVLLKRGDLYASGKKAKVN